MLEPDENMGDEAAPAQLVRWATRKNLPVRSVGGVEIFTRLLDLLGEDIKRAGLLETPLRAWKAWQEWTSGYGMSPTEVLKVFEDGAEHCGDEMIIVRGIEFYSHCEHHLAPFSGTVDVAYIPNLEEPRIVGLSKIARLVDVFAKRLQVQERMTNEIANALDTHLKPQGVGVIVQAKHYCMCSRGVQKQASTTITSALRGVVKDKPAARAEFISLVRSA